MQQVSGKALADSINGVITDKSLTDKQKVERVEKAVGIYKEMNQIIQLEKKIR